MEKKRAKPLSPRCTEKLLNRDGGGITDVFDVCVIRMGTFSFRPKWIEREVSESLTAAVALGVFGLGMVLGVMIGVLAGWDGGSVNCNCNSSRRLCYDVALQ